MSFNTKTSDDSHNEQSIHYVLDDGFIMEVISHGCEFVFISDQKRDRASERESERETKEINRVSRQFSWTRDETSELR